MKTPYKVRTKKRFILKSFQRKIEKLGQPN